MSIDKSVLEYVSVSIKNDAEKMFHDQRCDLKSEHLKKSDVTFQHYEQLLRRNELAKL